jgi:hypothetical protein
MSDIFYECRKCGRAYMEPGPAKYCHPDTVVKAIDPLLVEAALARRTNREPIYPVEDVEEFEEEDPGCELTAWGDKVVTHESGAKRANGDKIRWDLMPLAPMRDTAQIWTFGAKKYGDRNWEQGFKWSGPYASLQRHLQAWFAGEDFDPESGLSHLAHAACNLQMLQQFEYTYREGDDRPKDSCPPLRTAEVPAPAQQPIPPAPTPPLSTPPRW